MHATRKTAAALAATLACLLAAPSATQAGTDTHGRSKWKPATGTVAAAAAQSARGSEAARRDDALRQWRGRSKAEWTQTFWQWLASIPLKVGPTLDDGTNCAINQDGPVWFLAHAADTSITVTCTIPFGKAIFAPAAGYLNDYPCPDPTFEPAPGQTLEDFLVSPLIPLFDQTTAQVILDGRPLKVQRVTTSLFPFTAAVDLQAIDACITGSPQVGAIDGYVFVIEPPSRGDHALQVTSTGPLGNVAYNFLLKVR